VISEMTIIVQRAMLKIQAERMRELASKISSRSYRLEFEQGEGAFVKELEAMAAELKSVGNALGALAAVTAERLDSAEIEFTAADERTAGFYRGGE